MAKTKNGNGRNANRSQVKNPRAKRAHDSGTLLGQNAERRERWGVNIADPLKKPKNISVEKIRKAMRSYYK